MTFCILFAKILNVVCGCSSMVRIPAFQAGCVGSIPIICSTSEWTVLHSKSPAVQPGFSHTAPSFLLFPTKLCCANLRGAPPYGLMRKAGIHFITPTQDKLTNRRQVIGNIDPLSPVPALLRLSARRRSG